MKDTNAGSQLNTQGGTKTYRFKSFKQRADEIEINVSRRIVRDFDEPEEHGSYFAECVRKWNELNCTKDYTDFLRQVTKYQQSLAQVLYHKEEIVCALEGYLSLDHELVVEAILDLVTALARDLQDEVLPYYKRFVQRITPLIKSEVIEIVEAACNALAYLFKYLAKSLVQDLRPTFNLLSPMLGVEHQRANVRRFTAESMAFLIRKLRGPVLQQFVEHTVHAMLECPAAQLADFSQGLALLYFECMRNVDTQLHSRAAAIYTALLHELYKEELTGERLEDNNVYELVASVTKLCLHYTKRESAQQLWEVLLAEYDVQTRAVAEKTTLRIQPMVLLLGLLSTATIVRKGSRVSEYRPLFQRCQTAFTLAQSLASDEDAAQLVDNEQAMDIMARERVKWLVGLMQQSSVTDMVSTGKVLLDLVVANEPLPTVLSMALTLARLEWAQWNQILLPYLVRLTTDRWTTDRDTLLLFWADLFQNDLFKHSGSISSVVTARGQVLFPAKASNSGNVSANVPRALIEWLTEPIDWEAVVEQRQKIPTGEREEFGGFADESSDDSDDSDDEMDKDSDDSASSASEKLDNEAAPELAIKSAVLSVLSHVSIEPSVLFEGLHAFIGQLATTIAQLTAQLAEDSEFLQNPTSLTDGQGELWGDDASRALGLFAPKADRLYWGAYHQIFPLVSLLGRALSLEASAALHASTQLAADKLMDSWRQVLDHVFTAHASNPLLVEGMYKLADALKFVVSAGGGEQPLAAVKRQITDALSLQQLELIMPLVERNLMSMQPSLRISTLQLLSQFEQPQMKAATANKVGESCAIVQIGIELEQTACDLSTYRDRLNHLRRLAVMATSGRMPQIYRNVFGSLAVAQYALNFSTVWPEVTKQLGLLAGANVQLFWDAAWGLLQRFNDERLLIETGLTPEAQKWLQGCAETRAAECEFASTLKVDGHAIECPNLARVTRVHVAELARLADNTGLQNLAVAASCPKLERVDYANVQRQLLAMLTEVGARAVEAHATAVLPTFLSFVRYDFSWTASFFNKHTDPELALDEDIIGVCALEHRGLLVERTRQTDEARCVQWLKLLAKFHRPQKLYMAQVLQALFLRMLTRGDNELQRCALDCLIGWRLPGVQPYADSLRALVDEKRFRDTLKTFNLAVNGESVNVVHRAQLMPVVLRILHGQMMARSGKSSRKDGMRSRRAAILNAMVGITSDELRFFVGIGLETFRETIARATPRDLVANSTPFSLTYSVPAAADAGDEMDVDGDTSEVDSQSIVSEYVGNGAEMDSVSSKAQVSFLHLFSEMVRNLGNKSTPVFHEALTVILSSIAWAQRQLDIVNDELETLATKQADDPASNSNAEADSDDESVADDFQLADDEDNDNGEMPVGISARGELEQRKSAARAIRQLATKCLAQMFTLVAPSFSFTPYMPCVYEVVVDPRIDNLASENTQSSSALLLLLRSWTVTPAYFAYLTEYNPLTFPMLLDILVAPKVQPAVVFLVLVIVQAFLDYDPEIAVQKHGLSEDSAQACLELVQTTIQSHVSRILAHMRVCFSNANLAVGATTGQSSSSLVMHQIHILSRVAEYATKETHDAQALLDLLLPMLKRPNSLVPSRTKGDVLTIMLRFIPLVLSPVLSTTPHDEQRKLLTNYLASISDSFSRLRLDTARVTLTSILSLMATIDRDLQGPEAPQPTPLESAARLVEELNAYSTKKIGEPDYDRRLAAFAQLNEELWSRPEFDAHAWIPVLHNLVYFAQDEEEMAIRSNASFGLARFVTRTAQAFTADPQSDESQALGASMRTILLPSIKHMLASRPEVVQVEFLGVLRKAVRECGQFFAQLQDLLVLDTADEEANFFYNILHIQTHRRTRAMRRFRDLVAKNVDAHVQAVDQMDVDDASDAGSDAEDATAKPRKTKAAKQTIQPLVFNSEHASPISPSNIRSFIFPLLENWALAEGTQFSHDLSNEAIETVGVLGSVLPWSQYNATLRKYLKMAKKSSSLERRLMRLIMALLDHFHFDLRQVKVDEMGRLLDNGDDTVQPKEDAASTAAADPAVVDEQDEADADDEPVVATSGQAARNEQIHRVVVGVLLPELKKMITETKDDKLTLRAPVAMAIVRILTALPANTMNAQLPGMLTTICNMLRARAQSARGATRDTLVRILKFLGPTYFGFLVKELKASLSRGAHKHILSYTIYVLLKEIISEVGVGDLDYTLDLLVEILIQDVFGQVGEDKDSEEWITRMHEARVHHGPDCFEMLASVTSLDNVRSMLAPLRDILRETETPKRTRVVDNVLRRITIGINHNKAYDTKAVLIFCHGVINQYLAMSTKSAKDTKKVQEQADQLKRLRFASSEDAITVHVRRTDVAPKRDYLQANAHRFVQFGLDIVCFGLRRERFDTRDAGVLGMLDPFVDLAGNGLFSRYDAIITLCCKIWTIIVRLPLPSVPEGIPVVIKRLFAIFRQSSSTDSDMIQNCFKLLASLLRSKHAEKMMADYAPEELDIPDKSGNAAKTKKGAKGKKTVAISADCMKNSLINEEQLRDLIDFIRPDIEETERQGTAFNLIRAILTRRMIVDSLYKLLDTIRELMITAQDAGMRELCRLTWFQFLMDYPLGERRLTNAMSFIVQNASSYVYESGRISALEIMGVIIDRFADEILLPNAAEPFFLGLVLIIAKDECSQCREMAAHLLPVLIARFDQPRLNRVWILLDQWSAGIVKSTEPVPDLEPKQAAEAVVQRAKMRELGRAALQCYGIIIEPLGDKFTRRVPALLEAIDSALTVSLKSWKQAEMQLNRGANGQDAGDLESIAASLHSGSDPHHAALTYWETAYLALGAYGRLVKAMPQRALGDAGQSRIWLLAMRHLTHPHAWVRLAAARLFGAYVAMGDPSWMLEAEQQALFTALGESAAEWEVPEYRGPPKHVLFSVDMLKQVAQALVVQLNSRYVSSDLGNQVVKNLYFIARCFLTTAPRPEDAAEDVVEDTAEDDAGDAADASQSDSGSDSEDDEAADTDSGGTEQCLSWLINRVGGLARTELIRGRGSTEKRVYCFRWYAAIISLVPPALLTRSAYIMPIISPLYRTTEDSQLPANPVTLPNGTVKTPEEQLNEIKSLANEVLRLLQDRIGVTAFSAILVKLQKHVSDVRGQRRERRKQLAVIDPELHSKKKLRKHENTRRKRQERIMEHASKRVRIVVRRSYGKDSSAS
ncbi:U3 snoRNP protein [Coemansia sp. RSA 2711]|nr:U3 snoRNP protein [Coemansia sp. RSA 2711]